MTRGLVRFQAEGDLHFVTFSCFHCLPYFADAAARNCFLRTLERVRVQHSFDVIGYVVMPTHVHLLVSEPQGCLLAHALHGLKLSVAKTLTPRPFWQARYHDFNVYTRDKVVEKLKYMHRNPVKGGLVERPEDWRWSSYRDYLLEEKGMVEVDRGWM